MIDDGSSDGSAEIAESLNTRVFHQDHQGQSAARNRGIREAKGKVVVFTDADCVAAAGWLEKLVDPILNQESEGTVGRITSSQNHWVAELTQIELDERYSRMSNHDRIDFLNTGNCAFEKNLLEEKAFDEDFNWLEDVELSFRLARKGYEMLYIQDACVEHQHPESIWAYMIRKFRYAGYAPKIYRRYPSKVLADSRTPTNRKLQLALLSLGFCGLILFGVLGLGLTNWTGITGTLRDLTLGLSLVLILGSVIFSIPLVVRAFHESFRLGLIAPFFVLFGNIAFLVGAVYGLFSSSRSPG